MNRPTMDSMKLARDGWLNPGQRPPLTPADQMREAFREVLAKLRASSPPTEPTRNE